MSASKWKPLMAAVLFAGGCTAVDVPGDYVQTDREAALYPEYAGVTIPCNMAPLHFRIDEDADAYRTRLSCKSREWVGEGPKVCPGTADWRRLMDRAAGDSVCVEIYVCQRGEWQRLRPFYWHVSADTIDTWLSYRLIAPSYVAYEDLTICQRNLTGYDQEVIYGNMLLSGDGTGQCINCHAYQNGAPGKMQFHARGAYGGTVIAVDGRLKKVDLKNEAVVSGAVYPAWHPVHNYIAYSVNETGQMFHTRDAMKVEVQDAASDLVLYDVDRNELTGIRGDSTEMEVFPAWSADGKYLYYASAHYERQDTAVDYKYELAVRYREVKYNLYRRSFDAGTGCFGDPELVFDAAALGKSATLPRVSPDGRFLLFTLGGFGVFHIWHSDADLWLMDLQTAEARPLTEVNSPDVESYHTWSSSGRWIVFSSRRNDGSYTRPFFAHVDERGCVSKPFELPQDNPDCHRQLLRSYNIPEFMTAPVTVSPQGFAEVLRKVPEQAEWKGWQ